MPNPPAPAAAAADQAPEVEPVVEGEGEAAPPEHPPLPGGAQPPPMPAPNDEMDFEFVEFSQMAEDGEDIALATPCQDRSYRCKTGMFTSPCPKEFEQTLELRVAAGKTKPEDWKERAAELARKFKEAFPQSAGISKIVVAFERHRWLDNGEFAWHFHIIFVTTSNFAWAPIQKKMREDHGVHGWFTFEVPTYFII